MRDVCGNLFATGADNVQSVGAEACPKSIVSDVTYDVGDTGPAGGYI
jgi:hypothetical protein